MKSRPWSHFWRQSKDESHAYVISKLARHEIANTTIGDESVAVGY